MTMNEKENDGQPLLPVRFGIVMGWGRGTVSVSQVQCVKPEEEKEGVDQHVPAPARSKQTSRREDHA